MQNDSNDKIKKGKWKRRIIINLVQNVEAHKNKD